MPHVARVGTAIASASTSSTAVTLTQAVPVGTTIIGAIALEAGDGTAPAVTVTDAAGNTWAATTAGLAGTTVSVRIFASTITHALSSGQTVTVATATARTRLAIILEAFDDVTGGLDKSATNTGSGTALAAGTTTATAQANELVIGAFGYGGSPGGAFTAGTGYTAGAEVNIAAASSNRLVALEWSYVAAVGTQSPTGTISQTSTYAGAAATFPTSAPPPPTRTGKAKVWDGSSWVSHPVKTWSGTAWVVHPAKAWDGTQWVTGK